MKRINLLLFLFIYFGAGSFAQSGSIRGRVFNAFSNEAMPFVNVAIAGTTRGTATDANGNYEITGLEPGLYSVSASFVGFKTKTIPEVMVMGYKPAVADFPMEETVRQLGAVEIRAAAFEKKEESPVSLRTIGVNEIARSPGGNRDISKVIQSLPGVAQTVAYRNDIIIRGGSPNENRFYIDGIEIPNINHFATQGASGGPVGMLNVDFLREVEFYSGAFPAGRGNTLSSVLDFKYKDAPADRTSGKITLGSSDLGFTVEGPAHRNATFLASVRRSYLQFLFQALGLPFLPTYNDLQVKYKWKPSVHDELTVILLGALDDSKLNTSLQENGTEQQRYLLGYLPSYYQWNYTNGFKYVHYYKNSYLTLVYSRNFLNNESKKYEDNQNQDASKKILSYKSQEIENKLRAEMNLLKNDFKVNYGLGLEQAKYSNSTYNRITTPSGTDTLDFSSNLVFFKWAGWGQVSKELFTGRLTLSLGVRADGNNYDAAMARMADQLSPRFSLSYVLAPAWTLNLNTGSYYQLPAYTVLGYRDRTGTLVNRGNGVRFLHASHYVAGIDYLGIRDLKVSAEGFLKLYDRYPFSTRDSICLANLGSDFGVIGNEEVTSTGKGRSYGLELLFQHKMSKGFYALATYTFVRSEFLDKRGRYVASSWDSRHIVNVTAGKQFRHNWEAGIKWRFSMGSPYTPYDIDRSRLISSWTVTHQGIPDYNLLDSKRLKPFHSLDLRIDKKYFLRRMALNFYVDVQNAYNFQAEGIPILDVVRDAAGNPVTDPAKPDSYLVKTIDNPTGNVVPSIGVVVEF